MHTLRSANIVVFIETSKLYVCFFRIIVKNNRAGIRVEEYQPLKFHGNIDVLFTSKMLPW